MPANWRWSGALGRRTSERQGRRERLRFLRGANQRRSPYQRLVPCDVDCPYHRKPLGPPSIGTAVRPYGMLCNVNCD